MQVTNAIKSNNLVLVFRFYHWQWSPEVLKAAIELMESSDNIQGELLYKSVLTDDGESTTVFNGFRAYMPSFLGNMIVDKYGNTLLTKFGRWYNGAVNIKNITFNHTLYSHLFRNYGDAKIANNSLLLLWRPAIINELKRIYNNVASNFYNVYAFHSLEQELYVKDAYTLLNLDDTIGVKGTLVEETNTLSIASNLSSKVEIYYSDNPPIMPLASLTDGVIDGSETDGGGLGNGNHTGPDNFEQAGGGGGGGTGSGTTSSPSPTPSSSPSSTPGNVTPGAGNVSGELAGLKSSGSIPLLAFYVPYSLNDRKYEELNGMTIGEYYKQYVEDYWRHETEIPTTAEENFYKSLMKNRETAEETLSELLPEEEDE